MDQLPILIVEDDSMMADTLDSMVRLLGYKTLIARSSQQALDAGAQNRPGIVLLDLNLPDFDGFELCQRLKQRHDLRHTPIIFVSVESDPDVVQRALEIGAARYLIKPIGLDDLERAMIETLQEQEEASTNEKGASKVN